MFQFGQLVPELPVLGNIALPLLLTGKGRRAAMAAAREWVPRLGLESELGEVQSVLDHGVVAVHVQGAPEESLAPLMSEGMVVARLAPGGGSWWRARTSPG